MPKARRFWKVPGAECSRRSKEVLKRLQKVQKVPEFFLNVLEGSTSSLSGSEGFINGSFTVEVKLPDGFCCVSSRLFRSTNISLPEGDKNRAEPSEVT